MNSFLKVLIKLIIVFFLTALTQVGGLIFLLSLTSHSFIDKKATHRFLRKALKFANFLAFYFFISFVIVPPLAKSFGRVPLPITQDNHLQPLNVLTCFLNRHYVRPELQKVALEVASAMNKKHPQAIVNYLDANFPFVDGFPLPPHLSHKDGKKLDLAFCYLDKEGKATNSCPSFIGYGICEEPRFGEENKPDFCAEKGYWQYSFLKKVIPQGNKNEYIFDPVRTKELVLSFAAQEKIGKIFLEPHLKSRLKLGSNKIRFHGCQAVRHDDHIHVQLK